MTLFSIWIFELLVPLLFASGSAFAAPPHEAYEILGASIQASGQEIEQAYSQKKNQELSPEERARLEVSHAILSDPQLRKQYDAGKGGAMELEVPVEYRADLAELLKETNPKAASVLKRTGHAAVDTLGNMATFYLTMGTIQAWKCFQSKDPTYCRHYLEELKKPSGHVAFGLFIGSSKLASLGVLQGLGDTAASRSAAGFIGLAAGSMTNELFLEFVNHPATKEYLDAMSIKDPKEREEKKKKAFEKISAETFGNKEWYLDKIPGLVSLLGASYASDKTWHFALGRARKSLDGHKSVLAAGGKSSRAMRCFYSFLETYVLASDGLKGAPKFVQKRAMEAAGLLIFQAWSDVLNQPIRKAWDYVKIEGELTARRKGSPEAMKALLDRPTSAHRQALAKSLEETGKLWDLYRRKQMLESEQIMSLHLEEMVQFQKSVGTADLFYGWAVDGFSEEDPRWEMIRDQYYDAGTKSTDARVQKDVEKYLKGFFCGPPPAEAFHDSKNWHGLPVPGKIEVESDPYRVTAAADTALCSKASGEFKAELKRKDYHDEFRKASIAFKLAVRPARLAKLRFYEERVASLLTVSLQGSHGKNVQGLPIGVLPSYEQELADLHALAAQTQGTSYAALVGQRIESAEKKKSSAQELLTYMKTPFAKRLPPEEDPLQFLGGGEPASDSEWLKVIKYYHGYVIQ